MNCSFPGFFCTSIAFTVESYYSSINTLCRCNFLITLTREKKSGLVCEELRLLFRMELSEARRVRMYFVQTVTFYSHKNSSKGSSSTAQNPAVGSGCQQSICAFHLVSPSPKWKRTRKGLFLLCRGLLTFCRGRKPEDRARKGRPQRVEPLHNHFASVHPRLLPLPLAEWFPRLFKDPHYFPSPPFSPAFSPKPEFSCPRTLSDDIRRAFSRRRRGNQRGGSAPPAASRPRLLAQVPSLKGKGTKEMLDSNNKNQVKRKLYPLKEHLTRLSLGGFGGGSPRRWRGRRDGGQGRGWERSRRLRPGFPAQPAKQPQSCRLPRALCLHYISAVSISINACPDPGEKRAGDESASSPRPKSSRRDIVRLGPI